MKTIIVDDRIHAVNALLRIMKDIDPEGEHDGATEPQTALDLLRQNKKDIAFLDIEMPDENGLELAKEMKDINPAINIIFVTGYMDYAVDAIKLRCSDYLIKPVDREDVLDAIHNLRYPIERNPKKRIFIQCFGDFEVFVDGVPLELKRSRSLEVFAYLVDRRGARVLMSELQTVMWEDDEMRMSHHSQLRMFIQDIRNAFSRVGCEAPLLRGRGYVAIDMEMVDCDLYDYLEGDTFAVNRYQGEYMNQYSWAEMTAAALYNRDNI